MSAPTARRGPQGGPPLLAPALAGIPNDEINKMGGRTFEPPFGGAGVWHSYSYSLSQNGNLAGIDQSTILIYRGSATVSCLSIQASHCRRKRFEKAMLGTVYYSTLDGFM